MSLFFSKLPVHGAMSKLKPVVKTGLRGRGAYKQAGRGLLQVTFVSRLIVAERLAR